MRYWFQIENGSYARKHGKIRISHIQFRRSVENTGRWNKGFERQSFKIGT
jgi:hypothetical protein